jgi:hypothetical protein
MPLGGSHSPIGQRWPWRVAPTFPKTTSERAPPLRRQALPCVCYSNFAPYVWSLSCHGLETNANRWELGRQVSLGLFDMYREQVSERDESSSGHNSKEIIIAIREPEDGSCPYIGDAAKESSVSKRLRMLRRLETTRPTVCRL